MPMYDYKCPKCGVINELNHNWHARPMVLCTYCNEPMLKIIAATPAVFKGKGFYSTDK
jgi:putative FmdB family regulatory protein